MNNLVLSNLGRIFKDTGITAVRNLSLVIPAGSFTVIVGASGCGKTTLLRLIAGLEKLDAGEINYFGDNKAPRFGFMFQDPRLLPWLTVEDNLKLAFPAKSSKADGEIDRALAMVGLEKWKKVYPRKLSGGMAQRVALARALCRKPEVLLLDEPFGALDAFTRSHLRQELDELWKELNVTVVMVTHDIEEAVYLGDKVVQMKSGGIKGELEIPLSRPRQYHSAEFQDYCRKVEDALKG